MKKQPVVEGAQEVAEDMLRNREMGLTVVMHVEAPAGPRRRCQAW
jgi:hypothetical protein